MISVLGLVGLEPILAQAIIGWQAAGGYLPAAGGREMELEFSAGDGQALHVAITNGRVACFAAGPPLLSLPVCAS